MHAGLHKSGSTSVQASWHAAYSEIGPVWYPTRPPGALPGHHAAVWPLLDAFTEVQPADLVWAHAQYRHGQASLADFIARAERNGVETLLLSSEELDRLQESDVPRFRELLAGHELTFMLTITRPLHRWSSGWQELVKHGLAQYPRDGARHIEAYSCLGLGRIERLVGLLDAERRVVRVIRTSPHEDDMPRQLAEAVGVPWPADAIEPVTRNVSVGSGIEVLVRMNQADLGLGVVEKGLRTQLNALVESGGEEREAPELAELYEPPADFWTAAEDEHDFLTRRAAGAGVEVIDPHGLLETWTDRTPSSWYEHVSHHELDVPDLPQPLEAEELLWRVRQERSALRGRLRRSEAELEPLRRAGAQSQDEIRRLQERIEELEASRSWRITAPMRAATRLLGRRPGG